MRNQLELEIIFEGEYTKKERDLLWGQFFMELVKLKEKREDLTPCKTY